MTVERMHVAEYNKQQKVLSQKYWYWYWQYFSKQYWYWYRQYFLAKVLLLVLTILFTSIVSIRGLYSTYLQTIYTPWKNEVSAALLL